MAKQIPTITKLDVAEINNALRSVEKRIDRKLAILDAKIAELKRRQASA
jgi:hypothetical protein